MDIIEDKLCYTYKGYIKFRVTDAKDGLWIKGYLLEDSFDLFTYKDISFEKLVHQIDNAILALIRR